MIHYNSLYILDTERSWIAMVRNNLAGHFAKSNFTALHIENPTKKDIFNKISTVCKKKEPDAIMIPLSLARGENVGKDEGIWIANQVIKNCLVNIFIVLPNNVLQRKAVQSRLSSPLHTPHKNIDSVMKCLEKKCDCFKG